jgi:hypothetical protein
VVRVHPAVPIKLLKKHAYLRQRHHAFFVSTIKEPPRNHGNIFRGTLGFYRSRTTSLSPMRVVTGCRAQVPRHC